MLKGQIKAIDVNEKVPFILEMYSPAPVEFPNYKIKQQVEDVYNVKQS